jgi:hypothetical protein
VPPSPAGDPGREIYITPSTPEVLNCTLGSEADNVWGKGVAKIDALEIDGRVWIAAVLHSPTLQLTRRWRVAVFRYDQVGMLNLGCLAPSDPSYDPAACESQLDSISILHPQFTQPLKHTGSPLNLEFWLHEGRPHVAVTALKGHRMLDEEYHAGVWVFDVDDPLSPQWDTDNLHAENAYYYPAEGNAQKYFPYDFAIQPDVNATLISDPVQIQRLDNGDLLVIGSGVSAVRMGTPDAQAEVAYLASNVVDDVCPHGLGGGNGWIDPGEEIALAVMLENTGTGRATGVEATLVPVTPNVEVISADSSYPDLDPGASAEGLSEFRFRPDPTLVPCGPQLRLALLLSWEGGSSVAPFRLTVTPPCFPCLDCPAGVPARVQDLRVSRDGADLGFSWEPDPGADGGYHLYQTDLVVEAPVLRMSHPDYEPFLIAAPGEPLPVTYPDGVRQGLFYYQALGVCRDGITEGPN